MNKHLSFKKFACLIAVVALTPVLSQASEHTVKALDTRKLVGEMVIAGLIDTNNRVYINYSIKGLFINGTRLKDAAEIEWKRRFNEFGIAAPVQDNDGTDITIMPNAVPTMKKAGVQKTTHAELLPAEKE